MAEQTIFEGLQPLQTNLIDGDAKYNLGLGHTVSVSGAEHRGGLWRFPDDMPGVPTITMRLWEWVSDTVGILLASKAFTSPVAGQYNEVRWDTPVPLDANQRYVLTVFTDRYVISSGDDSPLLLGVTNGAVTAYADDTITPARNGKLGTSGVDGDYPDLSFGHGWYGLDPIIDVPDDPAEVTLTPATAILTAVALTPVSLPVTVALTPATVRLTAVATAPEAQPVTVALTPATAILAAGTLTIPGSASHTFATAAPRTGWRARDTRSSWDTADTDTAWATGPIRPRR